jgi:hypothetical protein
MLPIESSMNTRLELPELLAESETALWQAAVGDDRRRAQAAAQATNDHGMYELWRHRHKRLMRPVAHADGRFGQPAALRAIGVRLLERAALVDYLRGHRITGPSRDLLVMGFRQQRNPRRALLNEHRDYVLAVSSEACVAHLLRRLEDHSGGRLLAEYGAAYVESFAAFCRQMDATNTMPVRAHIPLAPQARRLQGLLSGTAFF